MSGCDSVDVVAVLGFAGSAGFVGSAAQIEVVAPAVPRAQAPVHVVIRIVGNTMPPAGFRLVRCNRGGMVCRIRHIVEGHLRYRLARKSYKVGSRPSHPPRTR